jgi:hypothetical protein
MRASWKFVTANRKRKVAALVTAFFAIGATSLADPPL